jgi:magnesium transporter
VAYSEGTVFELRDASTNDIEDVIRCSHAVVWINITGLGDATLISHIGEKFQLHRLALEDVVHPQQRPKVEPYGDHLFIVFRAPECLPPGSPISTEQISLFLLKNVVITFQEGREDCFNGVRERVRRSLGRIRRVGADYLMYSLLDAAIDGFFPLAEEIGEEIEALEESTSRRISMLTSRRIYRVKRELMSIRRAIWPLRELTNSLVRDEHPLIEQETRVHLRDCYDHCVRLMDIVENDRELATGLMEMHLAFASFRMNEVMKVLTLIATIFMPLTFIVGIYGMNFHPEQSPYNMPELNWKYGYFFALGLCVISAGGMLIYFRRRQWI